MSKYYCHYHYWHYLNKEFKNWDPNRFDWKKESWTLAWSCYDYTDTWWDPNRFNWEYYKYLIDCCYRFKHIWEDDYIIWKLQQ